MQLTKFSKKLKISFDRHLSKALSIRTPRRTFGILHFFNFVLLTINTIATLFIASTAGSGSSGIAILFSFILVCLLPGLYLLNIGLGPKRVDSWDSIILGTALGTCAAVFTSIFLGFIYPIPAKVYALFYWAFGIYALFNILVKKPVPHISAKYILTNHFQTRWILFNLLLGISLIPTAGLFVAPLHDPAANSIFSQWLMEKGVAWNVLPSSQRMYPPGAAFLFSILGAVVNEDGASVTLVSTNIFNVLVAFAVASFVKAVVRSRNIDLPAILACGFLATAVSSLYYLAGKNSQIISYFLFFTCLTTAILSFRWKKISLIFYVGISGGVATLFHYNAGISLGLGLLILVSFGLIETIKSTGFRASRRIFLSWIASGFIILLLDVLCAYSLMNYHHSMSTLSTALPVDTSPISRIASLFDTNIGAVYASFTNAWKDSYGQEKSIFFSHGAVMGYFVFLTLSPVLCFLDFRLFFRLVPIFSVFMATFLPFFLKIEMVQHYRVLNLQIATLLFGSIFFLIFMVFLSFSKWLVWPILIIIIGFLDKTPSKIRKEYFNARRFSVVTENDIKAFEWIAKNTPSTAKFIPANVAVNGSIFQTDAVMYLKLYAEREDFLPFVGGYSFRDQDFSQWELYQNFASNPRDGKVLLQLRNFGLTHVYQGAYTAFGEGPILFNMYPDIFEPVYDRNGVNIFKINFDIPD